MTDKKIKINIDELLFMNSYKVDNVPHLGIKDQAICSKCTDKPCLNFCPGRIYELKDERIIVGYEGCLECGACRIACPFSNIAWKYPRGGFGIQYRMA